MIKKEADNKYPLADVLKKRWSPVGFSSKEVEPEKIRSMFEAARWAPSSYNEQPWSFILASGISDENHAKIVDCLVEGNKTWAETVPVLILGIAKKTFSRSGKANNYGFYDLGQAVANLSIQATFDGLYLHQMAGFDAAKAKEIFDIPEDYQVAVAIAVGYIAEEDDIPDEFLARDKGKRTRRDTSEFVFSDKFGSKNKLF